MAARYAIFAVATLGFLAIGCGVGLLAASAWLISSAALQPPILTLEVAIVAVRAFGIGKGAFRYAERLVSHDAAFRALVERHRGLLPVEATMMVALPELDGSSGSMVYGGRSDAAGQACTGCSRRCTFAAADGAHDMQACSERADMQPDFEKAITAMRTAMRAAVAKVDPSLSEETIAKISEAMEQNMRGRGK